MYRYTAMKSSICMGKYAQRYHPKQGDSTKPSSIPSKPRDTCPRYEKPCTHDAKCETLRKPLG